jgi:hypothetical protein
MQEKSCLFIPLWFIALGFFVLSLIGCSHMAVDVMDCEEEPFVHTCPQKGHGVCPICHSEQEQIDLSVLDHCCVDCELVYEYEIYITPESNNEKTLVLD